MVLPASVLWWGFFLYYRCLKAAHSKKDKAMQPDAKRGLELRELFVHYNLYSSEAVGDVHIEVLVSLRCQMVKCVLAA